MLTTINVSLAALRLRPRTPTQWAYLMLWLVYLFCYPFAVAGIALDVHASFSMDWAGSIMLGIEGALAVLWLAQMLGWRRGGGLAAFVALGAFTAETIGTHSGWPFGPYQYTTILFPVLPGGVPLPVIGAWLFVIVAAIAVASRVPSGIARLTVATLLGVGLDLVLEPVAVHIEGYWRWLARGPYTGIPLSNFVGWGLLCALFCGVILAAWHTPLPAASAPGSGSARWLSVEVSGAWLYLLAALMFTLIDATHHLILPAVFGGLIIGACLALALRRRAAYDFDGRESQCPG